MGSNWDSAPKGDGAVSDASKPPASATPAETGGNGAISPDMRTMRDALIWTRNVAIEYYIFIVTKGKRVPPMPMVVVK